MKVAFRSKNRAQSISVRRIPKSKTISKNKGAKSEIQIVSDRTILKDYF